MDSLQKGRIVKFYKVGAHKLLVVLGLANVHLGITEGQGKVIAGAPFNVTLQKVVGKESHLEGLWPIRSHPASIEERRGFD